MAVKTNAMRILDSMKIPYTLHTYTCDEFIDGEQIADMLGLPYEKVYKTLVAQGSSKNYYVFVIPIAEKLDMKKAAAAVGEKSVAMLDYASCQGNQRCHRLYPRRLHRNRHEKAVHHLY